MKIAVYTIALNEEQFVDRWYESAKDADYLVIVDTGSTDKTVEKAEALGIVCHTISVKPWRFDDARNAALALLPDDADYCISLDMDEMLWVGWREELEKLDPKVVTRPRYLYTWSWNEDGSPGVQFDGDHIHTRHGYRWRHPVHEALFPDRIQEVHQKIDVQIHHHPDQSKSRSQYLPLLQQSTVEDPYNDRNSFYYARELYFYRMYPEAAVEFERYLNLPTATWTAERAAAYRYWARCEPSRTEELLQKSYEEDKLRRETMVDLAQYYHDKKDWLNSWNWATTALIIKEKPLDYLCEPYAWGATPHDLAAVAAFYQGDKKNAIIHGKHALEIEPTNERLKSNLEFYNA